MEQCPVPVREAPHVTELLIKRSRFLAQSCHVGSLDEGRAFVAAVKSRFPDARHNCWACVGGAAGDAGHAACSDDGEPHGTAGRPMLQILLHSGIGHICLVVTRWFGGIKLGTGGLVRAYQDSCRLNLESLPVSERQETREVDILLEYPFAGVCERLLEDYHATVLTSAYEAQIEYCVVLPKDAVEPFIAALGDATKGSCVVTPR